MYIVTDTNVLISALKSKQGAAYKLLMALPYNFYVPNVLIVPKVFAVMKK